LPLVDLMRLETILLYNDTLGKLTNTTPSRPGCRQNVLRQAFGASPRLPVLGSSHNASCWFDSPRTDFTTSGNPALGTVRAGKARSRDVADGIANAADLSTSAAAATAVSRQCLFFAFLYPTR